jgi:hypothetical protein
MRSVSTDQCMLGRVSRRQIPALSCSIAMPSSPFEIARMSTR